MGQFQNYSTMEWRLKYFNLTLYQPMTHTCVMSSHKPIRIYMGGLILGVNTLYRLFCFFKLFPMVGKGLYNTKGAGAWHLLWLYYDYSNLSPLSIEVYYNWHTCPTPNLHTQAWCPLYKMGSHNDVLGQSLNLLSRILSWVFYWHVSIVVYCYNDPF